MTALEVLCDQLNTNIGSLRTITTALQTHDAVTGVSSIEGGYVISFVTAASITIYNGEDGEAGATGATGAEGAEGHSPQVTIAIFEGEYYWKVDDEWLLDSSNNKIRAGAVDGANGTSPTFRITDGRWELSTNGGTTWTDYGPATGADGTGTSVFKAIDNTNDSYIVLTLADDSNITLPKQSTLLAITLDIEEAYGISAGGTVDIPYTITGGGESPEITLFTQNGWIATRTATTTTTGTIRITAPSPMNDDKVIVVVTDGLGRSIMKTLTFAVGTINLSNSSFTVASDAKSLECVLQTNADYTVEIADAAQTWITVESSKAMRNDTIRFVLTVNTGVTRHTTILLKDNGTLVESIFVLQNGSPIVYNVETAGTLSTLIPADVVSTISALKITGTLDVADYTYLKGLTNLRELDLSGVTDETMPASCFKSSTNITKIILPSSLIAIPPSYHQIILNLINVPSISADSIPNGDLQSFGT